MSPSRQEGSLATSRRDVQSATVTRAQFASSPEPSLTKPSSNAYTCRTPSVAASSFAVAASAFPFGTVTCICAREMS